MITRKLYCNCRIVISFLLCLLSLAQLKAQEQDKTKDWRNYIQQLPSREKYFSKNHINISNLETEESINITPSPLVRYCLSEDFQSKGRSNLLSNILALPLIYQSFSAKTQTQLKQTLSIDTCFRFALPLKQKGNKLISKSIKRTTEKWAIEYALYNSIMSHLQQNNLDYFSAIQLQPIAQQTGFRLEQEKLSIPQINEERIKNNDMHDIVQSLQIKKFEKKHWLTGFESSIQLSQNYVSENWYKGGQSNLNLHTRTYFKLTYHSNDGKIIWNNEVEDKLGLYSAQNQNEGQGYQISNDLLRLRSNFGLKAMKRWYYTIDGEFKTQLFNTYRNKNNTEVLQSAFFAPIHFNGGLGMKYTYGKSGKVYGRKFSISTNIAPLSFTYKKSFRDDIELSRYGFNPNKMSDYSIGSTIKAQINWQFNMDISWTSRLNFNTSYSHIETEWENTLNMKVGRYFSTRINLHLRYDDSVPPQSNWQRYLQINELLSFGFNYKL